MKPTRLHQSPPKGLAALAALLFACACCALQAGQVVPGWYADPQIRRFGDMYWMFPTYSHAYDESTFFDVFSSKDLETWTKHPHALDAKDVSWAHRCMWAPDAQEKDGRYYLFFSANDTYPVDGSRTGTVVRAFGDRAYGGIGVAVADRPEGPYRDLIGRPLIDQFWNGAQPIDQYVFAYKGDWYMVYGGWGRCNLVKLAPDFKSLLPLDAGGTMWRDMTPKDYVEGSVLFERRGVWYFMYSSGTWTLDDYRVNYSTATSPFGPFTFKGTVLSVQPPLATGAGHHSVICLPGTDEWRICYHRRPIPSLSPYHRVACIDRLDFAENGDILPVRMTESRVGDFADLETASSVLVDGKVRPGVVRLEADGRILVRSEEPLSRIEIEWPVALPRDAKVFGGDFERTYGDACWRPYTEALQSRRSLAWYCLVAANGRTDGYGVEVQPNVFASWRVLPGRIRLQLDCRAGTSPVELGGRTLEACRLVSRRGERGESAFAAARAFCRMMCPRPRLPAGPVYGYNDWYCAYGRNTATNFLADASFVVSLVEGETTRPYVVVDDGWQLGKQGTPRTTAARRWTAANEKWGMPMDELARRIKAMDAKPGLWYRPFLPDDASGDGDGLPIDPTDPSLEPRVRADVARFVDWGFEMVKVDFITFDWCGSWGFGFDQSPVARELPRWRDSRRTTAEVVKSLYAAIREAAGEKTVLIGCNALDHFAAGLFELQRTGDDTSGMEWDRTRKMGVNTLGMRAIHDGIFYRVDGDCFGLVSANAVPWHLNAQWLDLLSRSGTALFVSWKRGLTTPSARAALEEALRRAAHAQPTGEPIDWLESIRPAKWRFGDGTKTYDWD